MNVSLTPVGGRYPYALTRFNLADIRAQLTREGDQLRLRIDDVGNPDAWSEFLMDAESVRALASLPGVDLTDQGTDNWLDGFAAD